MSRRLAPTEMYPAGVPGVHSRLVTLPRGIRLRIAESGPADGPPVIMLHGWAASLYTWRHLLRDLPAAGYRGVAIDFRGHGLSDKPLTPGDYTRDTLIGDVLQTMDTLGIASAAIVGHSMGGGVALTMAIDHPDRVAALVGIAPVGFSRIPLADRFAKLSPNVLDVLSPYLIPRWVVTAVLHLASGDDSFIDEREIDEYWAPSRDSNYVRAMRALLREFDWQPATSEELRRVMIPALVLVGGVDRLVAGVGPVAGQLPRGQVLPFPGAGHMLHEERPHEANAAILTFLERHLSS